MDWKSLNYLFDRAVDEDEFEANRKFRQLVTLHIRVGLLSEVFSTAGYAHSRTALGLVQILFSSTQGVLVGHDGLHMLRPIPD